MKVSGFEGLNVDQFLIDIFKSKRKSSYIFPYNLKNLPPDSPSHKEWIDDIRDKMDSMARNKVRKLVDLPPNINLLETNNFST